MCILYFVTSFFYYYSSLGDSLFFFCWFMNQRVVLFTECVVEKEIVILLSLLKWK